MSRRAFFASEALTPKGWVFGLRLTVEAGRVVALERASAPAKGDVRIVGPLLPGMPNGHSHCFQRAMAGRAEWRPRGRSASDSHFWSWREEMYRWALSLSPEALGAVASLVALEGLKAGFTSVCEFHYLHHDPQGARYEQLDELSWRVISGMRAVGVAVTHLPVLYCHSGFGGQAPLDDQRRFICSLDEYARLIERCEERARHDPAVVVGLAPHSLRAVTPDQLTELLALRGSLGARVPVHLHISEQRAEVDGALKQLGARPVEWLLDHYELDPHWSLIHSTHLSAEEGRRLAQSEAVVGLCPSTEANLGDGLFPLRSHLEQGGSISVGTDSNISASLCEELRLLEYGQRLSSERRAVAALSVGEDPLSELHVGAGLWGVAARGGGAASARPCELQVGDWADWVTLDPDDEALWGLSGPKLVDAWVFASRRAQVRDAFVAGEQVLFEGKHPLEEQLIEAARAELSA